ncbi:MAG: DUF3014 domain-containing protein [Halieaceae bacterium]|nr:DUF3014 domain-containing protein [Halieaceae bacterium]
MAADRQGRHSTQTLLMAIAVLILAGGAWLLAPGDSEDSTEPPAPRTAETPAIAAAPQPQPDAAIRAAPDIPEPEPKPEPEPEAEAEVTSEAEDMPGSVEEQSVEPVVAAPPAAPTPEELDARLRRAIADTDLQPGEPVAASLAAPYLLDRGVSSADQLARGLVPRRTLNLARPQGRFTVERNGDQYRVDPRSYTRYDAIVAAITALPVNTLAALFQRFRDDLERAYASLGYPEDAMDNTIIAALDAIISAPVADREPLLVTRGALWAYANPDYESASDLHRQLLRTGPDNTRALKGWASRMREALLEP